MTEFQYKTYRVEWVTEVYPIDQYGFREPSEKLFYSKSWPTPEEALEDLERISEAHPYVQGRRVSNFADSPYHECGVRYREIEVK